MQIHELNTFEGELTTGVYVAVDNGDDTAKTPVTNITAGVEADLAQAQSDLNGRINNIISPSGTAPNPDEIIDARYGADGEQYANLGTAIRTQITNLKSDIGSLELNLTSDIESALIDSNNAVCKITQDGVFFNKETTPFCVAMLNTNILFIEDTALSKSQIYFMIAESSTAWLLLSMSGSCFYWKKDNSSYRGLDGLTGFSYPATVSFNEDNVLLPNGKRYSLSTINGWLSSKGVSDTVSFKLGVGCHNNLVRNTLPFRIPLNVNALHKEDLRYTLVKKQPFGILETNSPVQESENGIVFTNTSKNFWMTISNRVAYFGDAVHSPNNTWAVIAECENGVIILALPGSIYYLSKDVSVLTALDSGYNITLPTYLVVKDENRLYFSGYEITKTYLSGLLTSNNISDPLVSLRLGLACNKNESGILIPFMFASVANDGANNIKWANKTGDFLGDSLTAQGYYTGAFTSLYGVTVNNYGESGTTLTNIKTNYFATRIANMSTSCDFVFVMGGTNDWGLGAPLGSASALTDNDYSNFYSALYNTFKLLRQRFPSKPIFVSTITPRDWQSGGQASGIWNNGNGVSLMQFNDAVRYIAGVFGCHIIDGFASGINLYDLSTYTADNLHFNSAGGIRFATYCMDMMNQITPY